MMLTEPSRLGSATNYLSDHLVTINIKITGDSGIDMSIVIRKNKSSRSLIYNAYVNFVANDKVVRLTDINIELLSQLVSKYRDSMVELIKKDDEIRNDIAKKNKNILTYVLGDVKKLEEVYSFAEDLRKIDTYTIDAFSNSIIARTTIELDADVITILPQKISGDSKLALLLSLHNSNIYLTNQLFGSHVKAFTQFLLSLNKIIRLLSMIPFGVSIISSFWQLSALPAAITALVSFFLYRYAPRF